MKFRTLLFIVFIVFSTNTVTQAANLAPIVTSGGDFDASDSFPEEFELPFQYALDLGLVNYPPVELGKNQRHIRLWKGTICFELH